MPRALTEPSPDPARAYGGGAGGDSEGTISDSENSTTGDPDAGYTSSDGGSRGDRSAAGEEGGSAGEGVSRATSNPPLPHSPASSGGSQDGGSQDGGSQDGGSQDGGSHDGGSQDGGSHDGGSQDGGSHDGGSQDGDVDDASEGGRGGSESGKEEEEGRGSRRAPQQSAPRSSGSPKNDDPSQRGSRSRNSPERRDGLSIRRQRAVDEGGSESGCSSIHSPQRCFSPMEDEELPGSIIAPQRRFTSPGRQRSPPRSPSVSSPGSSRSGSVADSQVMFESGESSDQRYVGGAAAAARRGNSWIGARFLLWAVDRASRPLKTEGV